MIDTTDDSSGTSLAGLGPNMPIEAEAGRREAEIAETPAPRGQLEELARLCECLRGGRAVLVYGSRLLRGAPLRDLLERASAALPEQEREQAQRLIARRPLLAARFLRRRLTGDPLATADPTDAANMLLDLPFRARIDAVDPHEARRSIEPLWTRASFLFVGFDAEDPELAALL